MSTIKTDTRLTLLEMGAELILEQGFNHTGIDAILKRAGVPKGSFYHYFASKNEFGLAVLNHFGALYHEKLQTLMQDSNKSPLERIRLYYEASKAHFEENLCRKGCLFGNLGQEMADQHDEFRQRIDEFFQEWKRLLTGCLTEAQQLQEIPDSFNPSQLADFCIFGWEGAILRGKVTKTSAPLDIFIEILFNHTLRIIP